MPVKQPKINPKECRRAPREVLLHKPHGKLQICSEYRNIDVIQIRDISPFGLGLLLNHAVDKNAHVQLKYTSKGMLIETLGTVMWRKLVKLSDSHSIGAYGCWVGVFLHPSDIDANFALYQAIVNPT